MKSAKPPRPRKRGESWHVYVLVCADGTLYTGATNDLERRLSRHNAGRGAAYTRARRPVELVYSEPARGKGAALRREAAFKRLTRAQKLAFLRAAGITLPPRA